MPRRRPSTLRQHEASPLDASTQHRDDDTVDRVAPDAPVNATARSSKLSPTWTVDAASGSAPAATRSVAVVPLVRMLQSSSIGADDTFDAVDCANAGWPMARPASTPRRAGQRRPAGRR
ncbi:hypothetical protein ACQ859_15290 [Roseateles chitinivorans]|uniref:hypothetical protein n=1 Tax=Roseateles chitinivorans TaxID=2917965 RepID=UPI003D674465